MLEENNSIKVLDLLFQNPTNEFHIREIARKCKISPPSVMDCIKTLEKENLIYVKKKGNLKMVKSSGSKNFIRMKRVRNLELLYNSGVVDFINDKYDNPQCIILFGSYSRGDDIETSDIDIAIITKVHNELDTEKFERFLHRKISLHEIDLKKISKEFYNNLTNGIVVDGALI